MEEKVIWSISVNLSFLNLYSDLVAVPHMIFSGEREQLAITRILEGIQSG